MASLDVEQLSADSQYALRSFRTTADQVYRFLWPIRGHEFKANLFRATEPDTAELIPEAPFRSLAIAVRLAYMESEKGSFSAICDLLRPLRDPEVITGLARVEKDWADNLTGHRLIQFQTPEASYNPREVFDTWLYAQALHQDAKRQPAVEHLRGFEPMASVTLQLVVRQLAIAILNLDSVLRNALGVEQRDFAKGPLEDIATGIV